MSAALPFALRARFQAFIDEGLSGRAAAARLKYPRRQVFDGNASCVRLGQSRRKLRAALQMMASSLPTERFLKSW